MSNEHEEFLAEIRSAAEVLGIKPAALVDRSPHGNGTTWRRWVTGKGSPKLTTVTNLRKFMRDEIEKNERAT